MNNIKFIDLFAGLGGFRIGLESINAKCVFSSDNNKHAREIYYENFNETPHDDITEVDENNIPDFDILCGGFPCQSFSISGKQKGFNDTRGTLFFDICRILKAKQPKAFILENVKNLEKHDDGNTISIIIKELENLGYTTSYKILNAKDFGVPQNRERIIIIGYYGNKIFDFDKLKLNKVDSMKTFLDKDINFETLNTEEYTLIENEHLKRQKKSGLIFCGYLNKNIRKVGIKDKTNHLSRVHKQPNRIYSSDGNHPTLSSQEKSGRYWILDNNIVRKLTLNECYRFMGFDDSYKKIGSKSNLYERIGNSICVNMVKEIAHEIKKQFF